jgi:hypothetical protein
MYANKFTISSNSFCAINMSVVVSQDLRNANKLNSFDKERSALNNRINPNIKLFQINSLPYGAKENDTLKPYPLYAIVLNSFETIPSQVSLWALFINIQTRVKLNKIAFILFDSELQKIQMEGKHKINL